VSRWSDRVVRRAIGSVWRGRQVRWPLCRSIKVVRNAVHWSVQVQVPDFFPSLDGIYWITLRTFYIVYIHIYYIYIYIYIYIYYRLKTQRILRLLPLLYRRLLSLTHVLCDIYYDFLPHTFCTLRFCIMKKKKKVMKATIVSCPSSKKYLSFFTIFSLSFSLSLFLCHLLCLVFS